MLSNHAPPPPLAERIGLIAPRPVFLIYANPGQGGENERQPGYYEAAGEPKQLWKVPGAVAHGWDRRPAGRVRAARDRLPRRRTARALTTQQSWFSRPVSTS